MRALLIAGGAFGVAALLSASSLGKTAGKANKAAAAALGGHGFVVPDNASMVAAFEAMTSAYDHVDSVDEFVALAKMWTAAERAGAAADPAAYDVVSDWLCDVASDAVTVSKLATAYCALGSVGSQITWGALIGAGDADGARKKLFAAIGELARQMDAADYLSAAQRKQVEARRAKAADDSTTASVLGGALGAFDPRKLFGLAGALPDLGASIKGALSDAIVPVLVIGAAGVAIYLAVRK